MSAIERVSSDYLILIYFVKFNEKSAPSPDPYHEVAVQFRFFLSVAQNIRIKHVPLELLTAGVDKSLDE